jgi:hypothetical protein
MRRSTLIPTSWSIAPTTSVTSRCSRNVDDDWMITGSPA